MICVDGFWPSEHPASARRNWAEFSVSGFPMFHSSHHDQFSTSAFASNSGVVFAGSLRQFACLIVVVFSVSYVQAADPPPAPRNATPFVRPTQYHLLPPIYRAQVDRVPTVEDLVPMLDDSSSLRLRSGPVGRTTGASGQGASGINLTDDWPYTEATHGRRRIGRVSEIPARIGAFRPARVPSKYADNSSGFQQVHFQQPEFQPSLQQGQFREGRADAARFDVAPALFEAVSSPFVNQPVQHLVSPVWEGEVLEAEQWSTEPQWSGEPWGIERPASAIRTVNYSDNTPIPDPMMTTSPETPLSASPFTSESIPMSAPYGQEIHSVHPSDCQCDFCQSNSFTDPGVLFGNQPTAIISERQTTVRFDSLAWWSNSSSLPALASTSVAGTARNAAGVLGNPGTMSLFADNAFSAATPGFRIQLDRDLEGYGGIDFEFLQLATRSENLSASSAQFPILARPFTDITNGNQAASVIAFPGEHTGAIQLAMDSRFRSAAVHYYQLAMEEGSRSRDDQLVAKFQIGPRIATLQETLWTNDHSFDIVNNTSVQRTDAFKVENLFVGGEVGLELNRRFQHLDLSAGLSLAVGANRQKFQANGQSVLTDAVGQTSTSDSGWLSSSVGAGEIKRNQFSVIPAAELGIGFQTRWGWKLSFGYNMMLWTNAVRVTEQIPTGLNPTFGGGAVGGAMRPFSSLKDESFLAHGVSFGLERRW